MAIEDLCGCILNYLQKESFSEKSLKIVNAINIIREGGGKWHVEIKGYDKDEVVKELISCLMFISGIEDHHLSKETYFLKDLVRSFVPKKRSLNPWSYCSPEEPLDMLIYGEHAIERAKATLEGFIRLGVEDFQDVTGMITKQWVILRGIDLPLARAHCINTGGTLLHKTEWHEYEALVPVFYEKVPQVLVYLLSVLYDGNLFLYHEQNQVLQSIYCKKNFSSSILHFEMNIDDRVAILPVYETPEQIIHIPVSLVQENIGRMEYTDIFPEITRVLYEFSLAEFKTVAARIIEKYDTGAKDFDHKKLLQDVRCAYLDQAWQPGSRCHAGQGKMLLKIDRLPSQDFLRYVIKRLENVSGDIEIASEHLHEVFDPQIDDGLQGIETIQKTFEEALKRLDRYALLSPFMLHPVLQLLADFIRYHRSRYDCITERDSIFQIYIPCGWKMLPHFKLNQERARALFNLLIEEQRVDDSPEHNEIRQYFEKNTPLTIMLKKDSKQGISAQFLKSDDFKPITDFDVKMEIVRIEQTTPARMDELRKFIEAEYNKKLQADLEKPIQAFVKQWLQELESEYQQLELEGEECERQIETLQGEQKRVQSNIRNLQKKIDILDETIKNLENGTNDIVNELTRLNQSIQSIPDLTGLTGRHDFSEADIQRVRDIARAVKDLIKPIEMKLIDARFDRITAEIEQELESLNTTINTPIDKILRKL